MRTTLAILAGVAALSSGCGSDDDQESEKDATTPAPSAPADPARAYIGSFNGADMEGFKLTLRRNGTYSTRNGLNGEVDTGRYHAKGRQLVFTKSTACAKNFAGTGTYDYSVSGDRLVLKQSGKETGGCTGRSGNLTVPPAWVRTGGS